MVGKVSYEPATKALQPTLVNSASDAVNDPFVQGTLLVDTRNPHLALIAGGGYFNLDPKHNMAVAPSA